MIIFRYLIAGVIIKPVKKVAAIFCEEPG